MSKTVNRKLKGKTQYPWQFAAAEVVGHGDSPLTERPIDRCSNRRILQWVQKHCKGVPLRTFYTWVEVLNSRSSCLGLSQVLGSPCATTSHPTLKGNNSPASVQAASSSTCSAGTQSSLCTGQTSYSVLALQPFLLLLLVMAAQF